MAVVINNEYFERQRKTREEFITKYANGLDKDGYKFFGLEHASSFEYNYIDELFEKIRKIPAYEWFKQCCVYFRASDTRVWKYTYEPYLQEYTHKTRFCFCPAYNAVYMSRVISKSINLEHVLFHELGHWFQYNYFPETIPLCDVHRKELYFWCEDKVYDDHVLYRSLGQERFANYFAKLALAGLGRESIQKYMKQWVDREISEIMIQFKNY